MAYKVLSRYHRPNPTVEWHVGKVYDQALSDQIMAMMYTEFHGQKTRTVSEPDNLTLEIEFIWNTQAVYDDWAGRSIIIQQQQLIDEYNTSVGITADPKEKSEV